MARGNKKGKKKAGGSAPKSSPQKNVDELEFEDSDVESMSDEDMVEAGDEGMGEDGDKDMNVETKVWLPGKDALEEGEELEFSNAAYDMLHRMHVEWPCLSFDTLQDKLGMNRSKYPMTAYVVAGTQADKAEHNKLMVMKMSELHRTRNDSDEEAESDEDEDAQLDYRYFAHPGGVNRVRAMPQKTDIVATWAETGEVHVWDISKEVGALENPVPGAAWESRSTPVYSFHGHPTEGFAMDWSCKNEGHLLTGDCNKHIYHWAPGQSSWEVDKVPFTGHQDSVEDLQWSPTQDNVFASCSADKTVKIWDTRSKRDAALTVQAHEADVNVISWNRSVAYLLVSGSDDGSFRVWDLRNFKADAPAAHFKWHQSYITSVEWHPSDSSVIAVASSDQVSIWDLSVERDTEAEQGVDVDVPPQLLFVHMGQKDVKELHWHKQLTSTVVTTALDGFNIFKPSNFAE